jgi:hypothetical protein
VAGPIDPRAGGGGNATGLPSQCASGRIGRGPFLAREQIFADTKFNRRCDRFQRRGRSAARSEWRLITATHNLLKLHRHQLAPATATAGA